MILHCGSLTTPDHDHPTHPLPAPRLVPMIDIHISHQHQLSIPHSPNTILSTFEQTSSTRQYLYTVLTLLPFTHSTHTTMGLFGSSDPAVQQEKLIEKG
jgi:hypothetical protein